MPIRPFLAIALALMALSVSAFSGPALAEEPTTTPTGIPLIEEATATPTSTATPAPTRFFNTRLNTKVLNAAAGPFQDVQGRVIARTGRGVDGILVRAFSSDWQAFEISRDDGKFKFSLTPGAYTIQLVDVVAQEVSLTVDGKNELQVEFYEVEGLIVSPTPVAASPTATDTVTPTASPTETATPYPTSTPLSMPIAADTPTAEPTNTPVASLLSIPIEIDFAPWLRMLLYGGSIGGALVFFGLAVGLVRRW